MLDAAARARARARAATAGGARGGSSSGSSSWAWRFSCSSRAWPPPAAPSASGSYPGSGGAPRCRSSRPGPSAGETEAAGALVHGLYRLAANMAADGPLVLAIDDVDMADAATLRFLLYLVGRSRAAARGPVARPRIRRGGRGRDLLDEVLAHPATRRYRVEPLSERGTAAWLRASFFPDARRRLLRRRSRGRRRQSLARRRALRASWPSAGRVRRRGSDRARSRGGPRVGGRRPSCAVPARSPPTPPSCSRRRPCSVRAASSATRRR